MRALGRLLFEVILEFCIRNDDQQLYHFWILQAALCLNYLSYNSSSRAEGFVQQILANVTLASAAVVRELYLNFHGASLSWRAPRPGAGLGFHELRWRGT